MPRWPLNRLGETGSIEGARSCLGKKRPVACIIANNGVHGAKVKTIAIENVANNTIVRFIWFENYQIVSVLKADHGDKTKI